MAEEKIVMHPNGFYARLYGESSMIIYNSEGKERLHTGFRSCNTDDEVLEVLASQPALEEMLKDIAKATGMDADELAGEI